MERKRRIKVTIIICSVCSVILVSLLTMFLLNTNIYSLVYKDYVAPTPNVVSKWNENETITEFNADYYVSIDGNDLNPGSKNQPFRTIQKAKDVIRNIDKTGHNDITVCINPGEYTISNLCFEYLDSGNENCQIIYKGLGNVVFNSGQSLSPSSFKSVDEYPNIKNRLISEAKEHALVLDLTAEGISKEQIGKMYPYGSYDTSSQYQGDVTGPIYSELFIDKKRMDVARYPNTDYLKTDEVVFSSRGQGITLPNGDPKGDVYKVNQELANRISGWQDIDDVWLYGFFMYDWADQATSILSFDKTTNELTTKYYSFFGAKKDAPYYFYNCLEELDAPGEYYIDRENNLLVVYKTDGFDNSQIEISLTKEPVVRLNANYITFDNIEFTGTRDIGIYANGFNHHCTINNCKIYNVGKGGMLLLSNDCTITHNEVFDVGSYGVGLQAGDKNSLTKGNVTVSNNFIHDYQKIEKTLGAGIQTYGAGFYIGNNEIYNANHVAISYSGIYHVIENNLIHDVCLQSEDSGAIYAGRSWTSYGNVIRNNLIYNLGNKVNKPHGIYLDDALSGQMVYDNLLINVPGNALLMGGGRDLKIHNNIVINAGNNALFYDARAREGVLKDMWFSEHVKPGGDMWRDLYDTPWREESWQNAFPEYKDLTDDFSDRDNPYFIPNPANSDVSNNLVFDKRLSIGEINESVKKYSQIENNKSMSFGKTRRYFSDYKQGDYHLKDRTQYSFDIDKVGRY